MKILREVLSPLIAVIAAFVVGGLIIAILGDNPFEAYGLLLSNSFGFGGNCSTLIFSKS